MEIRTRLYVAGLVAALAAYIFTVIAFTGLLNFAQTGVFAVVFLVILLGFERFMMWAETLESEEATSAQI
ncbi:hypothetical protein ACFO0N_21075 [Halobium salinum]|uniref:Uncharacterized protein n=1 Tax=Halobium salinum TaxID=1364940 RepID=A0ABD5PHQ2_9EURY|nr:hypothetical protein [Halobium salinum]